ncbi:MAG: hypothetical protein ACQERN_00585 [Thermodesulfobacteriota bacterium]
MTENGDKISISARIEINSDTLQTIVANLKQAVGPDERGIYRIDTADAVNALITRFLAEKDFDAYVRDIENYRAVAGQ